MAQRLAITALLWLGLLCVCQAGDFAVDEKGRRFRVRFDPASEVRLGLVAGARSVLVPADEAAGAAGGSGSFEAVAELDLGILYRSFIEFGEKQEESISWQLDHQFLTGRIRPWSDGLDDLPELDVVAYTGSFLRHSAAPYMVLPTDPPKRFYFPFDVGVECSLGRVRIPSESEFPRILRLGLARASVLLDPWRPGKPGNSLEIGLGVSYDLEVVGEQTRMNPEVIHRLAPFTALSVRFRLQDRDGLTRFDLRGDLTPHWASSGSWGIGAQTTAHFERVLMAVNDEPVALVLEAGYECLPKSPGFEGAHELTFLAGLAFGLQLK